MRLNFLDAAGFWITPIILLSAIDIGSAQTNSVPLPPATNVATIQPALPDAPAGGTSTTTPIDPFRDPLIKQVAERHEKAANGDKKETKALTADLEKWTQEQPTNYLLQAYLGSVYTLDSRDAWPGPGKLTYLRNGGKWLDGAVASAPDNPAVRFIRAVDYYELPSFFGKSTTARDDFQILLKQIDGEVKTPYVLSPETQQAIYYFAGKSFYGLAQYSQAKDAWKKGWGLDPASDLGKKISTELAKAK